ncbi:MAG: transporter permease [Pseudonocardiales bacterium]|nr:transporter permease [Pseudonocardiales bacterium]
MNAPALRAALRIARRDAWRAKGRSLLVVALIGLPVFVLAGADIAYRTWQVGPAEKIERAIGAADIEVQWFGGAVVQDPKGWLGNGGIGWQGASGPRPTTAQMLAQLPAGSRAIERRTNENGTQIRTQAGLKRAKFVGMDYADPIARGLVHQVSGRAPANEHEVALTAALSASLGRHTGDQIHLVGPDRDVTVVGVVTDASHRNAQTVFALAQLVAPAGPLSPADSSGWLVDSPGPFTWQQVLHLNSVGFGAVSRTVYLHPPPKSQVPRSFGGSSPSSTAVLASGGLIAGMALLEVVLLAGPAFAVSARRQRRDLALIATVGGRPADLRNVVLANGVVLGLTAGVLSVVGGLIAASIGIPTLGRLVDAVPGQFDVRPLEMLGLAMVSLLTALAAAAFPARGAARTDVIAALAGRAGVMGTRKRVPVLGSIVAAAGALLAIGGATASSGTVPILTGIVILEVGLIICTPALLGLAARLGRHLPLAARIALRDAGRNRSSAAPAVAAVMAAVIGAVAIVIGVASSSAQQRSNYRPVLQNHDGYLTLDGTQSKRAPDIAAALRTAMPSAQVLVLRAPNQDCSANDPTCTTSQVGFELSGEAARRAFQQGRYQGGMAPQTVFDDGAAVAALFGTPVPSAVAALRAGKAVVLDSTAIHDGTVTVTATTVAATAADSGPQPSHPHTITIPAVVVGQGFAMTQLILPSSMAPRLGVTLQPAGVLVHSSRAPTDREMQVADGALNRIDDTLSLYVESGYHNANSWLLLALIAAAAVIAIAAAVIATALANLDSRTAMVTLAAVGAGPHTMRLLSMARAGVIAGIGTAIGVVAGFVPPAAWVQATRRIAGPPIPDEQTLGAQVTLVVPWLPIAAALVGIPVAAALVAGLFTRSRLPADRAAE